MKFFTVLALATVSMAARVPRQAVPETGNGVDLGQTIVSQLGTFTRQVSGIQSVLSDLSGQVNRMIATSSRLVTGQSDENGPASAGESALNVLSQFTNQFAAMQRVLSDLNGQLNRMIASSTRLVSGQSSDGNGPASIGESALSSLSQITSQLASVQRVLSDLSGQFNRMIETGSRLVSGQEAGNGSPAEAVLGTLNQITAQFAAAQRILGELNGQLNRMIASSTRLVSGLQDETTTAATGAVNPAEAALAAMNQFTQQFASMQRVLSDLSGQLNRMIQTGTRLVSGK